MSLQDEYTQTYYLMMDLEKAPFDDERVRCALAMSIDRDEIIDAIGGTGVAVPANGVFSPGQQGYLEDNGLSIEPDPDAARALIEDYEAETGEEVSVTISPHPGQQRQHRHGAGPGLRGATSASTSSCTRCSRTT